MLTIWQHVGVVQNYFVDGQGLTGGGIRPSRPFPANRSGKDCPGLRRRNLPEGTFVRDREVQISETYIGTMQRLNA